MINSESKTPIYVQIYQLLKEKIQKKEFHSDERLPSKRQLAKINNISQNTVMGAYNQLLVEGYIYSIERKGYYVSNIEFHSPPIPLKKEEDKEIQQDKKIHYDFTRSNPDQELFPYASFSKLYQKLFEKKERSLIEESDSQGLYPLRKELQKYLSLSRGVPCSTQQIILGPSSEYLLNILFQLLDKNLELGLEDPGYQGFQSLIRRSQISYQPIKLSEEGLNIKDLSQSTVNLMIVTSNHQFPTGHIMPLKKRQDLLNWANQGSERYIVENDYDSEFKYSGLPIPSLKYLDKKDRVVHLSSFTRLLSPGMRLAYMVLPEELSNRYQEKFSYHSASLSTFEQWIIHDFLAEGHFTKHLNHSRTFYKKKRDQFIKAIKQQDPKANILGGEAGLHLLIEPSFNFDPVLFKKEALKKKIKLTLLSDYRFSETKDKQKSIFLSFSSIPEQDIDQIIQDIFKIAEFAQIK